MEDLAVSLSSVMVNVGDRLGLYEALASANKPLDSNELSRITGTSERCIREWLANQAAGGYVIYDKETKRYRFPQEHAMVLANENSPIYLLGGFQAASAYFKDVEKISTAFKTGKGLAWGEHDHDLFEGTERFFGPNYRANIISSWIPSLGNGKVEEKLRRGAIVADVGCGHGLSTIIMAKAYPNSKFVGFDNHGPSIDRARNLAQKEGLGEKRITFEIQSAKDYPLLAPDTKYDLITIYDALHDMDDPVGAAYHALKSLKENGTMMLVEPSANDNLEDNLNPLGRIMFAGSACACVLSSMANNGLALGAQAGQAKIAEVMEKAGFKKFQLTIQTQVNMVYEAKPVQD
ncbi:class I SAM-dependent methyltransferase [Candidatus Nitrosocosmicus franklandus]|uniref:Demethylrebeccamycin-D-glucose O-methyltransferase n=1 Tax=Candidatus Nitrosocosmicus franklandianus TaxID=1798806 RepID=A0A484IAR4_9ARCH|nr:class I SAM-dependent methyltransferase [Candidatus Nitrosocosmicus franklandus]VFJ13307.1 Demethylrebeccamycin-D-glucose O-methyltransferase [Candidatus Nitrosocosmicus franklandus]